MSICRVIKNKHYTVMSNYHLNDKRLSLKAIGLLSKVLSLPDDWDYSYNGLIALCKEQKTAVVSALNELKEYGYLVITQTHQKGVRGLVTEYVFFENPNAENLNAENLNADFQPQQNTNIQSTNTQSTNIQSTNIQSTNNTNSTQCTSVIKEEKEEKEEEIYKGRLSRSDKQKDTLITINRDASHNISLAPPNGEASISHDISHPAVATHADDSSQFISQPESQNFALRPVEPQVEVLDKAKQLRIETWQAYEQAYQQRYGVKPLRNAKVNSQIKAFCELVGEDAPKIAGFYCFHSNKWYIQKGHDIGTLLTNAQAVARDFYSGRETTNTTAQWEEDRATVRSSAEEAKRLIEEWDRQAELKAEQEHNHA